jgi:thiamine-phosphate pyrophosphorylase
VEGGGARRIGLSTHDPGSWEADADLESTWGRWPVFPTASKEDPDPVVGLGFVAQARAATAKPLVAIGGIDAGNLGAVLAAGADTVAVLGAACRGDVGANCRRLLAAAA